MLNAKTGFFSSLVPDVVRNFGDAFPELRKNPQRVQQMIFEEEESFGKTLDRGIRLFADFAAASAQSRTISGADAFTLYDTYGFPLDLTKLMAEERGMRVDEGGYKEHEEKARELSRTGGKQEEAKGLALTGEQVAKLKYLGVEPTDDSAKYDGSPTTARVKAIWNGHSFDESAAVQLNASKRTIGIVTDRTNFYAAMGGQEADTGRVRVAAGHTGDFEVEETLAFGGYVLHIGHVARGSVRVGDSVSLDVDNGRRAAICANHTATHLANWALRETLGEGVEQKGSLVAPDRMRFDFSHGAPVPPEQLARVEELVRQRISDNLIVHADPAPLAIARGIVGLRAVFGEAYPDPVRVVAIGAPVEDLLTAPQSPEWRMYSVEFCGGTHVESTKQIGGFALMGEEAVAKGVRRITAVTGRAAADANRRADDLERAVREAATAADQFLPKVVVEIVGRIDAAEIPAVRRASLRASLAPLQERVKEASKQMADIVRKAAEKEARSIAEAALQANDLVIVGKVNAGEDRNALQAALKVVRDTCPRAAAMLFSLDDVQVKVSVIAGVPQAMQTKGLRAGDWVRDVSAIIGGKGGGRPDVAQGGGTEVGKLSEAMKGARASALRLVM
jgi:alanyl-tRNA synthetase